MCVSVDGFMASNARTDCLSFKAKQRKGKSFMENRDRTKRKQREKREEEMFSLQVFPSISLSPLGVTRYMHFM